MARTFREYLFTSNRIRAARSAIPSLLELMAMDCWYWRDDFCGDQLGFDATSPGTYQSSSSGTSAAAFNVTNPTAANGLGRLNSGSDDDGRSDFSLGLHCQGQLNAHFWARILTPNAITTWKFEAGFTDVLSGTDAGAVGTKATPTFNATDAVVLCRDTDDDTNLSLMGVQNGTAATVIDFSTALVAATYYYIGIELQGTSARGYLLDANGGMLEATTWMDNAVTATVNLTPWGFCQNRAASARNLDIDLLYCYQRRTTAA